MAPIAVTPESHSPQSLKASIVKDTVTEAPLSKASSQSSSGLADPITAAVELNDGNSVPQIALGVYKAPDGAETEAAVIAALDAGYRHIDSAARYANEAAVGRGINKWLAANAKPRSDIFITSKLWDADHGYESTLKALDESLTKFDLDYLDLYLIHSPSDDDHRRLESWRAMEFAKSSGKVRSIGVSNFGESHINHILTHGNAVPAVNQIEVHPFLPRQNLVDLCQKHGIKIEAYSPLARGNKLEDETVGAIAQKHGKTSAQVLLNWNASRGNVVLPKSLTPSRIESNAQIFDFALDDEDRAILGKLGQENYVTGSLHKSN